MINGMIMGTYVKKIAQSLVLMHISLDIIFD